MADDAFTLSWNADAVMAALRGASADGLEFAAEHLLQVSTQLAPHEEGDLARSGEVSSDADGQTFAVSFDRPYAVRQHEDLTLRHDDGKQAKYLEEPMSSEHDTMLRLIASRSQGLLG
ncbi:hypothetical protein [Actinoplanes sp. CA-252034]|uniref:hypothetical protein n=1 Tax=Actinoplanes sp. CA-252034 TaxID=3239906 RepID=UPI003D95F816